MTTHTRTVASQWSSSIANTPRSFKLPRLCLVVGLLALAGSACSQTDNGVLESIESETTTTEATATSTTEAMTTSTSETTTTTTSTTEVLSEREQAEAEVRRIAIEWYQLPVEDPEARIALATGLLRQRLIEGEAQLEAEGRFWQSPVVARIEVTGASVDLDRGFAEVDACNASGVQVIDAENLEIIIDSDPSNTTTSTFYLQLVDDEWLIYEWAPSSIQTSGAIPCEITS